MAPRRSARNKGNAELNVTEDNKPKPKEKTTKKAPAKSTKVEADNKVDEPINEMETGVPKDKVSNGKTTNKRGRKPANTNVTTTIDEEGEPLEKVSKASAPENDGGDVAQTIYEFKANNIKGDEVSLENYKGHVCIIVNVASRCGHTKTNYEQLVQLFDQYSESKGLRILAFPCNQFGKQEPSDAQKICEFAEKRNVKFDMFDKIDVNGTNAHPLWTFMQNKIAGPKGNKIDWNFTKFIIDKEGNVVERHKSSTKPLDMLKCLEEYW